MLEANDMFELPMSMELFAMLFHTKTKPPLDAPSQDECNGTKHVLVAAPDPEKRQFKCQCTVCDCTPTPGPNSS